MEGGAAAVRQLGHVVMALLRLKRLHCKAAAIQSLQFRRSRHFHVGEGPVQRLGPLLATGCGWLLPPVHGVQPVVGVRPHFVNVT